MVKHGYSGYLIPAEFKGEIYFSGAPHAEI